MVSKIIGKPGGNSSFGALKPGVTEEQAQALLAGAPDSKLGAAPAPAALVPKGGRKKPISLTIDANVLAALDQKAAALGISRAAAFSLAVSRFIAAEEREASR